MEKVSIKKLIIISGTTRGIGSGILLGFLSEKQDCITINRTKEQREDPNLLHKIKYDLADTQNIPALVADLFSSIKAEEYGEIILINNAAVIGETLKLGEQEAITLQKTLNVNLLAPMLLGNELIKALNNHSGEIAIINLSSGAAFQAIPGLGPYCVSKAGIEMYTGILATEYEGTRIKAISIGPGVVETQMQEKLRSSSSENFPSQMLFKSFKEKGQLKSVDEISHRIVQFVLKGEYTSGKYYEL